MCIDDTSALLSMHSVLGRSTIRAFSQIRDVYLLVPLLLLTLAMCSDDTSALHSVHSMLDKECEMRIQSGQGLRLLTSSMLPTFAMCIDDTSAIPRMQACWIRSVRCAFSLVKECACWYHLCC